MRVLDLQPAVKSTTRRLFALLLSTATLTSLSGAPVPHPTRPDRLVETRDGMSVEYSPGQEAWVEKAFVQMEAATRASSANAAPEPAPAASPTRPAAAGSNRDLRAKRDVLLAAIARQIGLRQPTELQGRTFDTFLGYYDLITELFQAGSEHFTALPPARRLAIWQRDDLVARLRQGVRIEGMSYNPATDSGNFEFRTDIDLPAFKERSAEIFATIEKQRLNHSFDFNKETYTASVTLRTPPPPPKPAQKSDSSTKSERAPEMVIPIIYRGELGTPPHDAAFSAIEFFRNAAAAAAREKFAAYRSSVLVGIILHETAEVGLVENIIASRDRRWLCDGTANYVAWRVTRDVLGADFAAEVYDLSAQLRLHAAQQSHINLASWSAAENQDKNHSNTDLSRAHYAFATRAIFLIAERHGDDAVAQLWTDVARTPIAKTSAKTFAAAYRQRYQADLAKLVREAERKPLPPPAPVTKAKS